MSDACWLVFMQCSTASEGRGEGMTRAEESCTDGLPVPPLTLTPLGVQLEHAVNQAHILVPPPLALPHNLGVATALCTGCRNVRVKEWHASWVGGRRLH